MLTENFVREMKKTIEEVRLLSSSGNVADYIPALKKKRPVDCCLLDLYKRRGLSSLW
ncbi:hypothetical protein [Geomicrobium sp. JCM 19055]|uniref:hypothetical protein n=1 Tax=Geomicrobium sp. JCM 19055 TaxID=1460649 RepID=UPI00045ECE68|nr:hypothetical protein [Geomicrobium sp. JCM 19055]GAJ99689.1 hypothetical protein JCM19055_2715 [Geomicrobium sp. JCM 19055]